jgi:hypothetical protein
MNPTVLTKFPQALRIANYADGAGYNRGAVVDPRCATACCVQAMHIVRSWGSLAPFGTIDSIGVLDTTNRYLGLGHWRDYSHHFFVPWID